MMINNLELRSKVVKDLDVCQHTFVVDIEEEVKTIYDKYEEYIIPSEEGIYINSRQLTATDLPGVTEDGREVVTLKDLNKVKEMVYISDWAIIPPKGKLRDALSLTGPEGSYDVVYDIIIACVKSEVITINPYNKLLPYTDLQLYLNYDNPFAFLYDYFVEDAKDLIDKQVIDPLTDLTCLIDRLERVIYDRKEYIWLIRIKDNKLEIGYTIDTRAYQYHILVNENDDDD